MNGRASRQRLQYAVAMAEKPDFPWMRMVRLIAFLDRHYRSGPEIEEHMGMSRQTAHNLLAQLAELKVLEKRDRPGDGRGGAQEYRLPSVSAVIDAVLKR